jgi:hypothetical protein
LYFQNLPKFLLDFRNRFLEQLSGTKKQSIDAFQGGNLLATEAAAAQTPHIDTV